MRTGQIGPQPKFGFPDNGGNQIQLVDRNNNVELLPRVPINSPNRIVPVPNPGGTFPNSDETKNNNEGD